MTFPKLTAGAPAIAIVAHPDDETIWLGGAILKNPQADWVIFCLSRSSDPDRAPKFKKVCAHYGARGIMTDLDDEGNLTIKQAVPQIKKLLLNNLKNKNFALLLTHGANGEYGHPLHLATHLAVKELLTKQKLQAKLSLACHYKKTSRRFGAPLAVKAGADIILLLSQKIFSEKRKIMTELYGFAPDGIDTGYCAKTEAFKKF